MGFFIGWRIQPLKARRRDHRRATKAGGGRSEKKKFVLPATLVVGFDSYCCGGCFICSKIGGFGGREL